MPESVAPRLPLCQGKARSAPVRRLSGWCSVLGERNATFLTLASITRPGCVAPSSLLWIDDVRDPSCSGRAAARRIRRVSSGWSIGGAMIYYVFLAYELRNLLALDAGSAGVSCGVRKRI